MIQDGRKKIAGMNRRLFHSLFSGIRHCSTACILQETPDLETRYQGLAAKLRRIRKGIEIRLTRAKEAK